MNEIFTYLLPLFPFPQIFVVGMFASDMFRLWVYSRDHLILSLTLYVNIMGELSQLLGIPDLSLNLQLAWFVRTVQLQCHLNQSFCLLCHSSFTHLDNDDESEHNDDEGDDVDDHNNVDPDPRDH